MLLLNHPLQPSVAVGENITFFKCNNVAFFMSAEKTSQEQTVAITYETLFDILRMEKRREDIQQLNKTFFEDVVRYLQQKREILTKIEHESGIENIYETKKLSIQHENIQKIINKIYYIID